LSEQGATNDERNAPSRRRDDRFAAANDSSIDECSNFRASA
jgi:hypothetical protein